MFKFIIIFCTLPLFLNCQQIPDIKEDSTFFSYLFNQEMYNDLLIATKNYKISNNYNTEFYNQICYYLGWIHLSKKQIDSSTVYFLKISKNSQFFPAATHYSSWNYAYTNNLSKAKIVLDNFETHDTIFSKLKNLHYSGISLLNNDLASFENYAKTFNYTYFATSAEEMNLLKIKDEITQFKPKSYLVAGLMSAIIPGSGKIYTNQLGQGISAFISVSVIGAIAAENLIKNGLGDYKTIFFSGLFFTFYLGNIYGSIISVKNYRKNFSDRINEKILYNMHTPLRTVFN